MKLVVNILDNELCSSKARINFNRNKIGRVVKLMRFFLENFPFENFLSVQVSIQTLKKVFTVVW